MAPRGPGVRIIVHKPSNWDKGNLFGAIIFDGDGNKIIVKLSDKIAGRQLTSDLRPLLFSPTTEV